MAYVGNTARLCMAIVDGDAEHVADWLSQEGANPDTRDYTGRAPIHLAAMASTPEIVKLLVDSGVRLIARLADGSQQSITQLTEEATVTRQAITKHLKVLEGAGLITRSREAQWRPCKLEAAPMRDVAAMVEFYRKFWEQNLDQLDAYLKKLQTPETKTKN